MGFYRWLDGWISIYRRWRAGGACQATSRVGCVCALERQLYAREKSDYEALVFEGKKTDTSYRPNIGYG